MSFPPRTPHTWMLPTVVEDIHRWALDDSDDDFGRVSSSYVPVVRRPAVGSGLGASTLSPNRRGHAAMSTADLTTEYITKRAKFKKRAEANLNKKVLDGLKQLSRCANRKIYAYDEQQVEKIFTQIEAALIEARKAFAADEGETKKAWVEL